MSGVAALDAAWRAANRLPPIAVGQDKDERGRVLVVGGSRLVPGAARLTGEAALRAGAGKVQIATVTAAAMPLGIAFPEAAVIGLAEDEAGEIAGDAATGLAERARRCDGVVIGPGMAEGDRLCGLLEALCGALAPDAAIVLDAGALTACRGRASVLADAAGRVVMTPHHGELASLLDAERDAVAGDPERFAGDAATAFGGIVVLKDSRTIIASPDGGLLAFESGVAGLGTAGSGDVLAGILGGLLARGMPPVAAAGWAVWLHAEAGRAAAARVGALGFLARELPGELPRVVEGCS